MFKSALKLCIKFLIRKKDITFWKRRIYDKRSKYMMKQLRCAVFFWYFCFKAPFSNSFCFICILRNVLTYSPLYACQEPWFIPYIFFIIPFPIFKMRNMSENNTYQACSYDLTMIRSTTLVIAIHQNNYQFSTKELSGTFFVHTKYSIMKKNRLYNTS